MDSLIEPDLFCPQCTYNLRGISSTRCPECGTEFSRDALSTSRIPWTHRHQIGYVRAYLRTLRLAAFHPAQLAAEAARPIHYEEANRFRWITIALATFILILPLAIACPFITQNQWSEAYSTVAYGFLTPSFFGFPMPESSAEMPAWQVLSTALLTGPGVILVFGISMALITAALTTLTGTLCRPRHVDIVQQNRAVALSCYGCTWVLFFPISIWVVGATLIAGPLLFTHEAIGPAVAVAIAIALPWWLNGAALTFRLTRSASRAVTWALIAPIAALLLLTAVPFFVNSLLALLALMWRSSWS